ncbi:hypothetical protein GCM10009117_17390 [Gangjinia marincola]|uniref:Uncharacterized protein n=1 Tax=Gangjinia marincola TaxID=578463 RepID=A0ABP3XTT6_9FLAO
MAQQEIATYQRTKKAVRDTIQIDSVSINPSFLKVYRDSIVLDTSSYKVDYSKAQLIFFQRPPADSITISYFPYPSFLTETYQLLDPSIIVTDDQNAEKRLKLNRPSEKNNFVPFDGLNTTGSISRGITIGTNQNAVLNSELDLQISGKLNEKVSLRASIQDANIPVQESGYSQSLDEFDQIFIELFSENWNIRAGDVDLIQDQSYFGSFTKKIQGLSMAANIPVKNSSVNMYGAGALVRGVFTRSEFTGLEGNQGPYKLTGPNGELFTLIVSGSERVFINGILLERGERNDYIIDYNAGEIIFNSTYQITSEMRIVVEYQFTDRNYTRVIATGGGRLTNKKWNIGGFVYSENDAKNQPLQQDLTEEQVDVLQTAGDDMQQMVAQSAVPTEFSEDNVLYRKTIINGEEIFILSNDPEDELFNVRFSLVGQGLGNYILIDENAVNRSFQYVAPVGGVRQGNYEPIIQLAAPTRLQLAVINGSYTPTEKTGINFELAGSRNDLNLFSAIDDNDNQGAALKFGIRQNIIDSLDLWSVNAKADYVFIEDRFRSIERLFNVEFTRDWNLSNPLGNQHYVTSGLSAAHPEKGNVIYDYQRLEFSQNFTGNRHLLLGNLKLDSLRVTTNSSYLVSTSDSLSTDFLRTNTQAQYSLKNAWFQAGYELENNQLTDRSIDSLTGISQRFDEYQLLAGIGDSTNRFIELGYRYRTNDSLRDGRLERVNISNNYFLNTQLIKNKKSSLSAQLNFRDLKYASDTLDDDLSLNARMLYNQLLANKIINLTTVYETSSGQVPRQDFTYIEVDPTQGQYTWNDYNNDGIQQLEEFELANFQDEATYVRVLLPNQVFLKSHQNKFSALVTLNFQNWIEEENKLKKLLSHFYNQFSYLIDQRGIRTANNFNLNPFKELEEDRLSVNQNVRNTLFFNRGKQNYTTSYSYISNEATNLLSTGLQESTLQSHQFTFNHKFATSWLIDLRGNLTEKTSFAENFVNRNFELDGFDLSPTLSYFFSPNTRLNFTYRYKEEDNQRAEFEALTQQQLGATFNFANKEKYALTGEFNYILNEFEGSPFSPVGYQMLDGLQPDTNYTWNLIVQKKLTTYLDLNLSYFGRKSEGFDTVHTGNVQLRAYF